jgi:hypothetical protein
MKVVHCKGITKDGRPCSAKARPGTDLCPWHTPELAEQRKAWSQTGGQHRSAAARAQKALGAKPMTLEALEAQLSLVFQRVFEGKLSPSIGNCLGALARSIAELRKSTEFEQRLAELEASAGIDRNIA